MGNNEVNQSLALSMIGALAPKELVDSLDKEIISMALSENKKYTLFNRKKAIMCMLRMYRKYPEKYDVKAWNKGIL